MSTMRYHHCQVEPMDSADPERMREDHEPEPWATDMWMTAVDGNDLVKRRYPIQVCSKCHCLYVDYDAE